MRLRYVSMTGADDAVDVAALNDVAQEFPFVEWAILLMPETFGQARSPSAAWIEGFKAAHRGRHRAMHLCGSALLGFVEGRRDILDLMTGFYRIQLNLEFGDVEGRYDPQALLARMQVHQEFDFIIQYTDKRAGMLPALAELPNHAILFDASAGRGVAPADWPAPIEGHFCGYAGGINPGNVADHIKKIAAVGADDTWIDMESGVRTDDHFDLDKVRAVLNIAKPIARP